MFNLASGTQGEGRFLQVPAMLELAGIAYTGPDPLGHARLSDRLALMTLLAQAGVPVPRHGLMTSPGDQIDISFPAAVRPRFEPENFAKNQQLLVPFAEIAERNGCSMAQLALAWLLVGFFVDMFIATSAVAMLTSGLIISIVDLSFAPPQVAVALTVVTAVVLANGHYAKAENIVKILVLAFSVLTILATREGTSITVIDNRQVVQ